MTAFLVTATGTEIGKTFVTAGLIHHFRATGQRIGAIKPVMTGYDPAAAATSDAGVLLQALGRKPWPTTVENMAPWHFRAPLSPDMAAKREGRSIDTDVLFAHCRVAMESTRGTLLIEGIGGIMVPLDETRTVLDWMKALDIPVLLVTGSYLGSISHTLTAIDALTHARLRVQTLIVNETVGSTVPLGDTMDSIGRFATGIPLVALRHGITADDPAFARIAALMK